MRSNRYLRTNEKEDAVRSIEWFARLVTEASKDPHQWKWALVALHGAAQGFMVLALWWGNGLHALRDRVAAKWLEAYRNGGPFPVEKLDEFLNLYAKVKDDKLLPGLGARNFTPGATHDESMRRLNDLRNQFIHFTPKGWSIELALLPKVCLDALDLIEWLGWESDAILWYNNAHRSRARRALSRARRLLRAIAQSAKLSRPKRRRRPR